MSKSISLSHQGRVFHFNLMLLWVYLSWLDYFITPDVYDKLTDKELQWREHLGLFDQIMDQRYTPADHEEMSQSEMQKLSEIDETAGDNALYAWQTYVESLEEDRLYNLTDADQSKWQYQLVCMGLVNVIKTFRSNLAEIEEHTFYADKYQTELTLLSPLEASLNTVVADFPMEVTDKLIVHAQHLATLWKLAVDNWIKIS